MILFSAEQRDSEAAGIVEAALRRSFTQRQVVRLTARDLPSPADGTCVVFLNPEAESATWLIDAAQRRSKALLLGQLAPAIAGMLGVAIDGAVPAGAGWSDCSPAPAAREHIEPRPCGICGYGLRRAEPDAQTISGAI